MVYKVDIPMNMRPFCQNGNCTNRCHHKGTYKENGMPYFRKYCEDCHEKITSEQRNLTTMEEVIAENANMSVREYRNSIGVYKHKKRYCENIDGRLGFVCTCSIHDPFCQLHLDHIDGNYKNTNPNNYQTLCASCHAYKTQHFGDNKTPGRNTLKRGYEPKPKKPKNEPVSADLMEFL